MRKFIARLFAAPATRTAPNTTARLSLNAMEDRYAPAGVLNPGTIRGFNPQPDPPGGATNPGIIRGFNPQPEPPSDAVVRTIIAIQPGPVGN